MDSKTQIDKLHSSVQALVDYKRRFRPDFHGSYMEVTALMSQIVADIADCENTGVSSETLVEIVAPARQIQAESPFVKRLQEWPRGYAGDFETVEYLMDQRNQAPKDTLAWYVEMHTLGTMVAQQHRNKVNHQAELILRNALNHEGHQRKILLIASGGAPDLRIVAAHIANADCRFVLNDIDINALEFARSKLGVLTDKCVFLQGNILACMSSIAAQGPFDLILAGGLFDYLNDRAAQVLLKGVFKKFCAPQSLFYFSNLAVGNPYRCWMEYLATWNLISRDEAAIQNMLKPFESEIADVTLTRDATGLTILTHVRTK